MVLILTARLAPEREAPEDNAPSLLDDMWHLAGRLERLSGPDEFYHLMRQFRRSYATSQLFEDTIALLGEEERRRIGRMLYQVIERHWHRDVATAKTLSAIASRLAPTLADDPYIRRFHAQLEKVLPEVAARFVSVIEPLCYAGMAQGMAGAFVANTRRMITDPHWRGEDYQDQLRYYGGVGQHALNIQRHMQQRTQELRLHDVGRVMAIYEDLTRRSGYQELAEQLKQDALAALATHELGASIQDKVEDQIERTARRQSTTIVINANHYNIIEENPQKPYNSQHNDKLLPNGTVENLPLIDRITSLLAEEGFNEQDRSVLAVKLTQIVEEARNPEKQPRRNARAAPTPEELRKARRIKSNAQRHNLPMTEEIREAQRIVTWVDREQRKRRAREMGQTGNNETMP